MVKIELEPLEHKDIIEYLKYALDRKQNKEEERCLKFDTTKYDIHRIKFLIDILSKNRDRTILNKKGIGEGNVFYNSKKN